MPVIQSDKPFNISINSLDDLERFLGIIRNEELNHKGVAEQIKRLSDSSELLRQAVKSSGG